MRIQHNIAALNSYRNLTNNNSAVAKNLEKLSSGYRINRAGDDAAGLAISEKMRAQITGLETAQKNAQDGISLVQTAEGALTEVHSMLNRMVELADQSANGTYQNEVDRENLQKEINSLKSEIDRISESTNFNGIDLLNGKVNATDGVKTGNLVFKELDAVKAGELGTIGDAKNNGVLQPNTKEVQYATDIYFGKLTNNNVADKKLEFTYKDNTGADQTFDLIVKAGATITTEDVVNALTGTVDSTKFDTTNTKDNGTDAKKFVDLYDVSVNGNQISIKAKASDGTIDASNLSSVTIDATAFDADDIDAATDSLRKDDANQGGANVTNINFGVADTSHDTKYQAAQTGNYERASVDFTVTADSAAAAHNTSIKVGDKTYVLQNGNEEVKGAPGDAVIVKLDGTEDADGIADKLAAAISRDEKNNGGYQATVNGDKLIISESTNRAQKVLDGELKAGFASDIVSTKPLTVGGGTSQATGTLATFDAAKMTSGTSVTVGGKTYTFVDSDDKKVGANETKLVYDKEASSSELAQMLADALEKDGLTGVSTEGASVKLADTDIGTNTKVSAGGVGLTLQIGDTADEFNRLSVRIDSTSTASLGIDNVDITTQDGAVKAIDMLKNAINTVSSTRGDLGAVQNRLEHTINNLSVTTENMTAAESRIRDVDMAKEMMSYTKNNILVQASQAMLAQANQVPQGVLQLLG